MANEVKVSIIVPVYRSREWIGRCLDSLLNQSLQAIEVILVDDHGGDDTLSIARAIGDERIRYAETPCNSGPGAARNVGIEAARGEYITFCDADDWVEPQMYERLYTLAVENRADMASAEAVMDCPDGSRRVMSNPRANGKLDVETRKQVLRHFVSNFTTTLFRREWMLENELRFPNARSGEDSAFMACCYLMAECVVQIREPLYHYVIHEDSISHRRRVWRGGEKHKAFRAMLRYAAARGKMKEYGTTLKWIYVKKALIMALIDYYRSL